MTWTLASLISGTGVYIVLNTLVVGAGEGDSLGHKIKNREIINERKGENFIKLGKKFREKERIFFGSKP